MGKNRGTCLGIMPLQGELNGAGVRWGLFLNPAQPGLPHSQQFGKTRIWKYTVETSSKGGAVATVLPNIQKQQQQANGAPGFNFKSHRFPNPFKSYQIVFQILSNLFPNLIKSFSKSNVMITQVPKLKAGATQANGLGQTHSLLPLTSRLSHLCIF